jgi:hypothetical protein
MNRIALTDDTGRWFDEEKATSWAETKTFNGNNMISDATGELWEHETLYRTAGGRWILYHWSDWQGVMDTWREIGSNAKAAQWLVRCDYDPHEACADEYAALEVR